MAKYSICTRLVIQIESEVDAKDETEAKEKVEAQVNGQNTLGGTLDSPSRDRVCIKGTEFEHVSVLTLETKDPKRSTHWKVVGGPYKNPPWTEEGKREREGSV